MKAWALALVALGGGCAVPADAPSGVAEAEGVELTAEEGPLRALVAERVVFAAEDEVKAEGVQAQIAGGVPLSIASERSTWDLKTRQAVFEGSVVAKRGPFELRCARLEVESDSAGQPTRAVATGGVRVSRPPWTASGAKAELRLSEGVLTLSGAPRVSDGQSELTGEQVVLHLDDERVACDRCTLVLPDPLREGGG